MRLSARLLRRVQEPCAGRNEQGMAGYESDGRQNSSEENCGSTRRDFGFDPSPSNCSLNHAVAHPFAFPLGTEDSTYSTYTLNDPFVVNFVLHVIINPRFQIVAHQTNTESHSTDKHSYMQEASL
jgi:hypothetical protein